MALWILLNYSVFDNAVDNLSKKQKKKKSTVWGRCGWVRRRAQRHRRAARKQNKKTITRVTSLKL